VRMYASQAFGKATGTKPMTEKKGKGKNSIVKRDTRKETDGIRRRERRVERASDIVKGRSRLCHPLRRRKSLWSARSRGVPEKENSSQLSPPRSRSRKCGEATGGGQSKKKLRVLQDGVKEKGRSKSSNAWKKKRPVSRRDRKDKEREEKKREGAPPPAAALRKEKEARRQRRVAGGRQEKPSALRKRRGGDRYSPIGG